MLRVIAIDGPAASGKSSTAGLVAQQLGWAHLDSGALYRALTLASLDNLKEGEGGEWPAQQVIALAERLPVRLVLVEGTFKPEVAGADVEEAIRGDRVTRHVSTLAAIPEVRTWVNAQQRRAVAGGGGSGGFGGVVVDGRDIGTVVFPDAPLKIFLTATPDARARRRLSQRRQEVDEDLVRRESEVLAARDAADTTRRIAPLKAAGDAVVLDTTALTLEEQVLRVVELARQRFPK